MKEVPHNGLYLLVTPTLAAARQAHAMLLTLGQHISFAPTPSQSPTKRQRKAASNTAGPSTPCSSASCAVADRIALVLSVNGTKVPPPPSTHAHILVGSLPALSAHCCARRAAAARTEAVLFLNAEKTFSGRTARLAHILRHRLGETQVHLHCFIVVWPCFQKLASCRGPIGTPAAAAQGTLQASERCHC